MQFHRQIIVEMLILLIQRNNRLNILAMPIVELIVSWFFDQRYINRLANNIDNLCAGIWEYTVLTPIYNTWHFNLIQKQTDGIELIQRIEHLMFAQHQNRAYLVPFLQSHFDETFAFFDEHSQNIGRGNRCLFVSSRYQRNILALVHQPIHILSVNSLNSPPLQK